MTTKSRCPKCAEKGKDNHGDNLITYPDGHSYCYACGYVIPSSTTQKLRNKIQGTTTELQEITFPSDIQETLPEKAVRWVRKYGITQYELSKAKALWSEFRQLLIFPIRRNSALVGWIGRYFGDGNYPKWIIKGNFKNEPFVLSAPKTTSTLVLVEDMISAIKVSRYTDAAPLFGATISISNMLRYINLPYTRIVFWLDPDKQKEMLVFARCMSLFAKDIDVVFSSGDPKEHDDKEIKQHLNL